MKQFAVAGGRFSTKFVDTGRLRTCGKERGCQLSLRGKSHYQPCISTDRGGRIMRGSGKNILNRAHGCGGYSQLPGLIIDASCVLMEVVGVLSYPERGAVMINLGNSARRVDL